MRLIASGCRVVGVGPENFVCAATVPRKSIGCQVASYARDLPHQPFPELDCPRTAAARVKFSGLSKDLVDIATSNACVIGTTTMLE